MTHRFLVTSIALVVAGIAWLSMESCQTTDPIHDAPEELGSGVGMPVLQGGEIRPAIGSPQAPPATPLDAPSVPVDPHSEQYEGPTASLDGVALLANGDPVEGATIQVEAVPHIDGADDLFLARATTDAAGAFRLRVLRDTQYRLRAWRFRDDSGLFGNLAMVIGGQTAEVVLRELGFQASIAVLDRATGRPVPGAVLRPAAWELRAEVDLETDALGRAVLDALPEGWNSVVVRAAGYETTRTAVMASPIALEHTVRLSPRAALAVSVVDSASKEPIAGVTLLIGSLGEVSTYQTDATGTATIYSTTHGTTRIDAFAPGYAPKSTTHSTSDGPLEIELGRGRTLRVRNTTDGDAFVRVELGLRRGHLHDTFLLGAGESRDIEGVLPGIHLTLEAARPNGTMDYRRVIIKPGHELDDEIEFPSKDRADNGVPCTISLPSESGETQARVFRATSKRSPDSVLLRTYWAQVPGAEHVIWRPSGETLLIQEFLPTGDRVGREVELGPMELALEFPAPKRWTLEGTVYETDGAPAVGFVLVLTDAQSGEVLGRASTNTTGQFKVAAHTSRREKLLLRGHDRTGAPRLHMELEGSYEHVDVRLPEAD